MSLPDEIPAVDPASARPGPLQLRPALVRITGMAESIALRPAQTADATALADLLIGCKRTLLPYLPEVHSAAEVRDWLAHRLIPGGGVSVAWLDARVVGMLAMSRDDEFGWIDQLYLQPDMILQGLGSALLTRAMQLLGAPVRLYTFQLNTGARRFYQRHGFEVIAFSDGQDNEERCPDLLFEWRGGTP